jgi:hypothetical protein
MIKHGSDRILGGWMIRRAGDVVCVLYRAQGDKERWFLGLASKSRSTVSPGLTSKSVASGFPVWVSKSATVFGDLGHKITATGSWFVPQNPAGDGLSVAPQNR